MEYQRQSFQLGANLTPLGKKIIIIYSVIYVMELILEHWIHFPIVRLLQIHPIGDPDFKLLQIVTHPFIHDPLSPLGFMIDLIVFYFFAGPVEHSFGPRNFLFLFYIAAVGSMVCGLLFSLVQGFNAPFLGMLPSILALIVVFGLLNPEATILLMFILPIKAKYLSYGTTLVTFLTFLAKANPHGAFHLGGILFGYIYFKYPYIFNFNFLQFKLMEMRLKHRKSKFQVINGQKDNDDKPTLH